MKTRVLRALLLVSIPAAFTVVPETAFASNLCGFVVTAPGTYVMPHDHTCPSGDAIEVDADDVTIDLNGFKLSGQGNTGNGIDISGFSDNVTVTNGIIRGFDTGIQAGNCLLIVGLGNVSNLAIQDVRVRNSTTDGIRICQAEGANSITNTGVVGTGERGIELGGPGTITNTLVRDAGTGIHLQPASAANHLVTVTSSRVEDVAASAINVSAVGGSGFSALADITDSTITDAARGITTSGDVSITVSGMSISETANEAIKILASTTAGAAPFSIENTTITDIGGALLAGAIVIQDRSGGGNITATTIDGVEDAPAILIACSSQLVGVEDSLIKNADEEGVLVTDTASPSGLACQNVLRPEAIFLHGNVIRSNDGSGATFLTGRGHSLIGNVFRANGDDGLFLSSLVTESFLTDNLARRNVDDGFQFDTADLELTGNVARGNTGFGFETNFIGPVLVDNGQTAENNTAGQCSDPSDLPNTSDCIVVP